MPRARPGDYPRYWNSKIDQIGLLVKQAYEHEISDFLDVRDLKNVGQRSDNNWRGSIELSSDGIVRSGRTYLRGLGKVLLESEILRAYGEVEFAITVKNDLTLQVRRLRDQEAGETIVELSHPFSRIFLDHDEAVWAFDFLRQTLLGLGVSGPDDPRFAFTLRHENRALRLNFGNWALLQFYAPGLRTYRIGIPLIEGLLDLGEEWEVWEPFATEDGTTVRIYEMPLDHVKSMDPELSEAYKLTLEYAGARFANWARSNFRRHNIAEIAAAVFDAEQRDHLLAEGLNTEGTQETVRIWWVNQGKSFDAAREGGYIWAPLESKAGSSFYYWDDLAEVKEGDIIVHYSNTAIRAISRVTNSAVIAELPDQANEGDWEKQGRLVKCRYQDLQPPIPAQQFLDALQQVETDQGPLAVDGRVKQGYLFNLGAEGLAAIVETSRDAQWPDYVLDLLDLEPYSAPETNAVCSIADCSAGTGFDEAVLARWVRAINHKKQAILYGPPGTGKTFVAEWLQQHLVGGGDGIWDLIQFHPAYAYEDFIQGIRPQARADGTLTYELVPGRFLDFCRKARQRKGLSVLIIDEVNRANLSRVFGELMYLLEYREKEVPLAAGGAFSIPKQVRIIGTMNTADRSIALVDHALRRRFAFLSVRPNYEILKRFHQRHQTRFPVEPLISVLQHLNRAIDDTNYEVGITFFLHEDLRERLADIWEMEIVPYLEEYFFDRPDRVSEFRWDVVKSKIPL